MFALVNESKSRTRPFNVPDFSLSFFMSSTALRRTSLSPSWTSSCRNNLVGMETRIYHVTFQTQKSVFGNWKMKIVKIYVNRDQFLYNDHISDFLRLHFNRVINRNCGDLCHLPSSSIFIFVARASPVALPFATNHEWICNTRTTSAKG